MGDLSKYKIYRKYMTSDGVNYTPLDEYQAVVTDLISRDCLLDYDYVITYGQSDVQIQFINKDGNITYTSISYLEEYDTDVYVYADMLDDRIGIQFIGTNPKDIVYINWDKIFSMKSMFYNYKNPIDTTYFDTKNVTNMAYAFTQCSSLTSLDVSNFNTSNVTDMSYMFSGCTSLTSLDVSKWDTSNVTNMSSMFDKCSKLTSLDLSNFDTFNVTNMSYMFRNCSGLTSLDVSNFDTSNVTNMSYMFDKCSKLTSVDLSNFDTSNVTNVSYMFRNCRGLTSLDLSGWDLTNVTTYTNYSSMFSNCNSLQYIYVCGCNQATIDKINNVKPANAELVSNPYVFNNEYVCDSELDVEQNGYKYEIWREVDCLDNSIYTGNIEYRNPIESCDCGWTGLTWVFNNEYINGSELQNARYISFTDIDTATPFRTVRIDATDPGTSGYYFIRLSTSPNSTGSNQSYSICPDEGTIWDGGSSKIITAQTHIEGKIYEYTFSRDMYLATNQEKYSPLYQVSAYIDGYDENSKYEIWRETKECNVTDFTGNVEYRNPQPL